MGQWGRRQERVGGTGEALSPQKSCYVTLDNYLFFALRLTPSKQVKGQFCSP